MVMRLAAAGARGWVLFNRFLNPAISLQRMRVVPTLHLSSSDESLMLLRWIAILSGQVPISFAASSGVHTANDVVKLLLAGADATMMASALLRRGPSLVDFTIASPDPHHFYARRDPIPLGLTRPHRVLATLELRRARDHQHPALGAESPVWGRLAVVRRVVRPYLRPPAAAILSRRFGVWHASRSSRRRARGCPCGCAVTRCSPSRC